MIVIPAIDLRGGKCVRMKQGDPTTSRSSYDGDPVERAKAFVGRRRTALARDRSRRRVRLGRKSRRGRANLQGGRVFQCRPAAACARVKHAEDAFAAGASEIIIGTLLVEDERLARHIISRFPEKVIAGIDARGNASRDSRMARAHAGRPRRARTRVAQWGVTRIIFTEIRRDGMGEGYDIEALNAVANCRRSEGHCQRRRAQHRRPAHAQTRSPVHRRLVHRRQRAL